jgi:autophagy-related protein 101
VQAQCGDAEVERTIEEKLNTLARWVERNPGKRATVALSFFEKRFKNSWFAKQEERLYWEQWRVHLDVRPPHMQPQSGDDTAAQRHAVQTQLQACVLELLRLVNDRREHIPPVVSSDVRPTPSLSAPLTQTRLVSEKPSTEWNPSGQPGVATIASSRKHATH